MAVDDSYTKLLLHFNGADNGTAFVDEAGNTLTTNGVVTKTGTKKFGSASAYQSTREHYLFNRNNADWAFGTGAFTIDTWIYPTYADSNYNVLFDTRPTDNVTGVCASLINSRLVVLISSVIVISGATDLNLNTWYHVALVGNGAANGSRNIKLYLNGVQEGETYTYDYNFTSGNLVISNFFGGTLGFIGYFDEFRVSKGIARWTADFTPPTAEYGAATPSTVTRRFAQII